MAELNEAFREIDPYDKQLDKRRKEVIDSIGMCKVVRFARCSWQVLCTRFLLDCAIYVSKIDTKWW